jgi:hypothetical protein
VDEDELLSSSLLPWVYLSIYLLRQTVPCLIDRILSILGNKKPAGLGRA